MLRLDASVMGYNPMQATFIKYLFTGWTSSWVDTIEQNFKSVLFMD